MSARFRRLPPGLGGVLFLLACGQGDRPIQIGLALSLEEPAVAPMLRGAALAVEEINGSGGIGGRKLLLLQRDDSGDPDSAVRVALDLYASDAVAVIGGAYSGVTLAAAPIFNGGRHPVVQISPSASSPALSGSGPYTFRICPSDLEYGPALARWAREHLGLKRPAVLYVNDEYGRGIRRSFDTEFTRLGGQLSELDPFLAALPDVRSYLNRIAKKKTVDAVIIAANLTEGLEVLRQVRQADLGVPILGGDGFVGVETTGPLAEGMQLPTAYLVGTASGANQAFVAAYRRRYPSAGLPDQGAAASYDAVYLLRRAIAEGGPDRRRIRDVLAGIGSRSSSFEGVTGQIAFDGNGDVPNLGVRIGVVRGGKLVAAQE